MPSQDKNFGKVYLPTHSGGGASLRSYDIDTQKYRLGLYQGGKSNIETLASSSGGRAFWDVKKSYPDAVNNITREFAGQYIFTFAASSEGTTPAHTLRLVPNRSGLQIDVPSAYFAAGK